MSGESESIRPDQTKAGFGKGQGFVPAIRASAERGARAATPRAGVVPAVEFEFHSSNRAIYGCR